jgi:hypothetical protein
MVHGYRGIRRALDGNCLHGVCLAQSVSVRAMNAAAIGGERPLSIQRGRVFHLTPRRGLILCLGSAAALDLVRAAAIAR